MDGRLEASKIRFASLEIYLNQGLSLYSYSGGKIQSRVYRVYLEPDTKKIVGVILESGYLVPVIAQSLIQSTSDNDISLSFNLPLLKLPKKSHISAIRLYEEERPDARVRSQRQQDLLSLQYRLVRTEVAEYLFVHPETQKMLQGLKNALSLPVGVRKEATKLILESIFDELTSFQDESIPLLNTLPSGTCQDLSEEYCQKQTQCRCLPIQKMVQEERIRYLLKNVVDIVAKRGVLQDELRKQGLEYSTSLSPRENLLNLLQKRFPLNPSDTTPTNCTLFISSQGNPGLKQQFLNQLAEELIQINTRSREILKKRVFSEEETGLVFREGDEYLVHSPNETGLKRLLADRLSQNFMSNKIPFSLANDSSLMKYQSLRPVKPIACPEVQLGPSDVEVR